MYDISIERIVDMVVEELKRNNVYDKVVKSYSGPSEEKSFAQPVNEQEDLIVKRMKETTSARICIGSSGCRLNTYDYIKFRTDHAAAIDSIKYEVDDEFLSEFGMKQYKTKCADLDEYLTRPDLGRQFDEETKKMIKEESYSGADVTVYVAGGLSSKAVKANTGDILPALIDGLTMRGITCGKPFYVKYGRVGSMDEISEILGSKVTCVLIGERPGLATSESLSAYIAYDAKVGMPEARRTVVSNIHRRGTPAAEAGAYIAELMEKMIKTKKSGVDF